MKVTRCAVTVMVLALLATPLAAGAPLAGKVWRIGVLGGVAATPESPRGASFRQGLRALGYIEGQHIAIEWRSSGGRAERFPDLAAELVRLKVDVIVATDNPAIAAAQKATSTIPIVMVVAMDPVRTGFVGSLARPGGNTTGLTVQATDIQGKALQLLKDAVPTVSRVAVLWVPPSPGATCRRPKRRRPPVRWGWRCTCWRCAAPPSWRASSRRWCASGWTPSWCRGAK